jgi:hypothetical protein
LSTSKRSEMGVSLIALVLRTSGNVQSEHTPMPAAPLSP